MKRILLGTVAMIALAAPAFAADLPPRTYTKAPAYTPPEQAIYNWTGFYIGGHLGGAFPGNNSLESSNGRFFGGVQGGYDYQFAPNWVVGVEAQYSWLAGNHRDGYTVGAGLEYMFAPNWSAKIEYQYYNFGNTTFSSGPAEIVGSRFRDDEHTVKAGINYRFGWGGPVATRY
jgi:outer membrane immunogenic protein